MVETITWVFAIIFAALIFAALIAARIAVWAGIFAIVGWALPSLDAATVKATGLELWHIGALIGLVTLIAVK